MATHNALPIASAPLLQHHRRIDAASDANRDSWRSSMSSDQLPGSFQDSVFEQHHASNHSHSHSNSHAHDHGHDHSHDHDHSHAHNHSNSHGHGHTLSQPQARDRTGSQASYLSARPGSMALDGWTLEKTASGKSVIAPGFETESAPYAPPKITQKQEMIDRSVERSWFTNALLPFAARFPLIHAIMLEKDSRRIFYFMTLNFAFMLVQAFYGYVTDSLGLLSDSIHMFFDCVALLVGLIAAVMSKWPPSQRFPYGFGKIETLSGFANGVLLMLLSVEIAFEAFERLWEGTQTKRLSELLIVSSMGLAVNLVGMMAFGHHHHHGHGHDHGHSHSHAPAQSHGHSHGHDHSHSHTSEPKGHDCRSHDNENMHGIYLHVLADTLGSVSVIVSTILTSVWGWSGWDPLASCFIAILIFLSSQPLVVSCAKRLLLTVPEDTEYTLRNLLSGISEQRGVVGYSVPKFWRDDRFGGDEGDKLVGVVHVCAARGYALDEVRDRVRDYLVQEGIDVVVQVEREGDNACWCARERGLVPPTPKPY